MKNSARMLYTVLGIVMVMVMGTAIANPAPQAKDWAATDIAMPVHQVGPHSYYAAGRLEEASAENQGFIANAGFVITDDGVVVFDSLGSPSLMDRMIREIRKRTQQPITLAIISHYHADHFYGIPALKAVGAQVWADKRAKAYLYSPVAQERLTQRKQIIGKYLGPSFKLPLPDKWIDGDTPIHFEKGGVKFTVERLGAAHTPEDLEMLVEPDGVLYSGDVVYEGRVPFIGDADTTKWLATLNRLLKIDCKVLVPGHGPASYHPQQDVKLTRDYLEFLQTQMMQAVEGFEDFDTAYAAIDWSRYKDIPTFNAANRRNAYSVYLQMQEKWLKQGK